MTVRVCLLVTLAALACETRAPTVAPRDATLDQPDTIEPLDATKTPDAPAAPDVALDASEASVPEVPRVAVTTFHHDIQRTGANRAERVLTPERLRSGAFGRDPAFAPTLDGDVYGQPLYLPRVAIAGSERAVVYVATQANSLYALDADTGATLWRTRVAPAVPLARMPCGNIGPTTGTVSTPVIVRETGTLYAVSYTSDNGGLARYFVISAVDVATGALRRGFPARIAPPASNGSTFDPGAQGQRGALTYVDGRVYIPFGGLANDCGVFHGWVVGVDPIDPSDQTAFATPGVASGIWSYGGPSADGAGNLYVSTGNGRTPTSMGSRVIRLGTGARGPTYEDTTARWFAPSNHLTLDGGDVDLNSIQPMVLPTHAGSRTPRLLFQAGKSGIAYLLDRDDLGGVGRGNGDVGEGVFSAPVSGRGAFGAAATWSDGRDVYVFVPSRGYRFGGCNGRDDPGGILTLRLRTDLTGSAFTRTWCSAGVSNPSAPTVSSNGDRDAVLWVAGTTPPELRAYDVAEGVEVYRATGADAPPSVRQWVPPVVVEGSVYVTGSVTVLRYRLRSGG
jgi:outer membrane protein assembly factor BamB